MREIKFRAWDNSIPGLQNNMVYFNLSTDNRWIHEKGISIMQFTGLKDKNGKEIYEGDIVKHKKVDNMILYGVTECIFGHLPREVKWEGCGFRPFSGWINDAHKKFQWEIIGNIWENKELLK